MSRRKRKICVVTGTRAEYGLLYWLMKEIQADDTLVLQVAVTGMHLSPEFGFTYKVIETDGFRIDAKIEMLLSSDTTVGVTKSVGLGVIGFADAWERLKPDIIVILGDRFEMLAAAQAALIARIPIAHIHGGEATEGLIDEPIRHSLTKMSHLHFVAAEDYRCRVIQLGEQPTKVYNFGAIGLDNIKKLKLLSREELQQDLGFHFGKINFLVTYHPVTLSKTGSSRPMKELLQVVDSYKDAKIIFTKPNSDTGNSDIVRMIDEYVALNPQRAVAFTSMGQLRYLSTLQFIDVVIGNSSSALIEVPEFHKPSINIGDRQKGRLIASSVVSCRDEKNSIIQAIDKVLSVEFQKTLNNVVSPYVAKDELSVSQRIKAVIKNIEIQDLVMKRFYDLSEIS